MNRASNVCPACEVDQQGGEAMGRFYLTGMPWSRAAFCVPRILRVSGL